jgi:putative DNA primase/helicase
MVLAVSDIQSGYHHAVQFSELNALPIADVFTKITGIDTKSCGTDCLEPEDSVCPLCGNKGNFRLHTDSNQAYCYSFKSITV